MNLSSFFIKSLQPPSQSFNYQIVRWRRIRKPFWLGVAKSKMFVVPQPKIIRTPEETENFQKLYNDYNLHLESLKKFIVVEKPLLENNEFLEGSEIKIGMNLEEMISESIKRNESWNAECAEFREKRTKALKEEEIEQAIREVDEHEERRMKTMEMIEEIVRKEKDLSKTFITPENLDEAVEKCLNKVECYDFAIDLDGNRYEGRETLPSPYSNTEKATASGS